jgi:hypothetical protein
VDCNRNRRHEQVWIRLSAGLSGGALIALTAFQASTGWGQQSLTDLEFRYASDGPHIDTVFAATAKRLTTGTIAGGDCRIDLRGDPNRLVRTYPTCQP